MYFDQREFDLRGGSTMRVFLIAVLAVLAVLAGDFFYFSDQDISRATLEAKYATPPSQFVQLPDGARAHVRDRGPRNASVLVLVHGSQLSLFTWEPWASRLDNTFRVVTMDLPGHGLTGAVPSGDYTQKGMVEFVKAVADQLGLGQSSSAAIRWAAESRYASRRPIPTASHSSFCAHYPAFAGGPDLERPDCSQEHYHRCDHRSNLGFRAHGGHPRGHSCALQPTPEYLHQGSHRRGRGTDVDPVGRRGSWHPGGRRAWIRQSHLWLEAHYLPWYRPLSAGRNAGPVGSGCARVPVDDEQTVGSVEARLDAESLNQGLRPFNEYIDAVCSPTPCPAHTAIFMIRPYRQA